MYFWLSVLGIIIIILVNLGVNWFENSLPEPPTELLNFNNSLEVIRVIGSVVGFSAFIIGLFTRPRNNPS